METNISLLTVEILTALLAIGLVVLGLVVPPDQRKGIGYVTAAGLIAILAISFDFKGINDTFMNGMYLIDDFGNFFKQISLVAAILVVLSSISYVNNQIEHYRGEFFTLIVFALLGMMVMVSAGDFVTLYLGLELMTITFYALTGYRRGDSESAEAGMKYVLLGGISSAIILYGISMIYGATTTIMIYDVAGFVSNEGLSPALLLGIIFLIAGFGFKISMVPFHMWSPDVYQGAPTPIAAFLAVGSKAAAFAAFVRVFLGGLTPVIEGWLTIIVALAALSIVIGNLIAIPQTNIKRMLAFSGVAQAGYILTGMIAASEKGIEGLGYYLMIYAFATVGAFTVVAEVSKVTGSNEIKDMAGLAQRSPLMFTTMLVCLLSMAGIPPLAGFAGKLMLFTAVVQEGFLWLALLGLVMSMVSVYYYLNVCKVMYSGEASDMSPIDISGTAKFVLLLSVVATIIFGIYPTPIADLANSAAQALFMY